MGAPSPPRCGIVRPAVLAVLFETMTATTRIPNCFMIDPIENALITSRSHHLNHYIAASFLGQPVAVYGAVGPRDTQGPSPFIVKWRTVVSARGSKLDLCLMPVILYLSTASSLDPGIHPVFDRAEREEL